MEDSVRLEEIVAELARDQKETRAALREAAQARNETEQSIKELAQAQKDTEQSIKELAQAQKDTEQSVKELAQIQTRTDESVAELSATVKDLALAQQQTDKNVAKLDRTVHAIGARWGVQSEASFREALSGILSDLGFEVENYIKHDTEGRVHGHPAQVEIDVVIRDGKLMLIEIKSSMNRSDVYTLERVVEFYEAQENRKVDRKLVVCPFFKPGVIDVAEKLGIEVFTDVTDVL
jgi:hypothetical protein